MEWILSGIGTQAIFFIIASFTAGGAVGGTVGYKIGVKFKNKQSQKAGDNANQVMVGPINNNNGHK